MPHGSREPEKIGAEPTTCPAVVTRHWCNGVRQGHVKFLDKLDHRSCGAQITSINQEPCVKCNTGLVINARQKTYYVCVIA